MIPEPRAVCRRCMRPETVCYCAALTSIPTATRIVILQHPRERNMPIGTARMASLCLPNCRLHVGVDWDASEALRDACADPGRPPILLWPGPDARDVLADPPKGPVTLVVVDGTWSQAKALVRDNPRLASLPRYAFRAPEPTTYRIRREPRAEYVSTIEALMHVLGALEGEPERFRALLVPMRTMIDAHLARKPAERVFRFHRPRADAAPAPASPIPAVVRERPDSLVCVVGEANAWPRRVEGSPPDELVHWVARRVTTGETFDAVAAPERALAPGTPAHTGLAAERVLAGRPRAEVVAEFASFLRPGDVLCSWGHYGPALFASAGGTLPDERIDVRAVARRLTDRRVGALEEYAASVGADPPAGPLPDGRAGRRLGLLVAVVAAWVAGDGRGAGAADGES